MVGGLRLYLVSCVYGKYTKEIMKLYQQRIRESVWKMSFSIISHAVIAVCINAIARCHSRARRHEKIVDLGCDLIYSSRKEVIRWNDVIEHLIEWELTPWDLEKHFWPQNWYHGPSESCSGLKLTSGTIEKFYWHQNESQWPYWSKNRF